MKRPVQTIIVLMMLAGLFSCQSTENSAAPDARYRISIVNKRDILVTQYLAEAKALMDRKNHEKAMKLYKTILILDPKNDEALSKMEEIKRWLPVIDEKSQIIESKEKEIEKTKTDFASEREKILLLMNETKTLSDKVRTQEEENQRLKDESEILQSIEQAKNAEVARDFQKAGGILKKTLIRYPLHSEKIEKSLVELKKSEDAWKKAQEEEKRLKKQLEEEKEKLQAEENKEKESSKKAAAQRPAPERKPAVPVAEKKETPQSVDEIVKEKYLFETMPDELTREHKYEYLEDKALRIYLQGLEKANRWVAEYFEEDGNLSRALSFYNNLLRNFPDSTDAQSYRKKAEDIDAQLKSTPVSAREKKITQKTNDSPEAAQRTEKENTLKMYLQSIGDAYFWIGNYYKERGQNEQAIGFFQQLYDDVPESEYTDDALFAIAEIYFNQGKWDNSLLQLYKVMDNFPRTSLLRDVYLKICYVYRQQKNFVKALELYGELKDTTPPGDERTLLDVETARTCVESGQYDKAVPLFMEVLQLGTRNKYYDAAEYYLGDTFYQKGDYETARKIYEKIRDGYAFNPFRPRAVFRIAETFYKEKNNVDCLETLEKALSYYPDYEDTDRFYVMQGECYRNISRYDMAERSYQSLIKKYPKSDLLGDAYYGIAEVLLHQKKVKEAKEYLTRLVEKFPSSEAALKAYSELGKIAMEENRYEAADGYFQTALKEAGEGITALKMQYYRSVAYEKTDKDDDAVQLLDNTIKAYSENLEKEGVFSEEDKSSVKDFLYNFYLEKAKILFKKKDLAKSIELYEKAVADYPRGEENDWVLYHVARIYENLGEREKAVNIYKRIQTEYSDKYWAEQAGFRLKTIDWEGKYGDKIKDMSSENGTI
jgi:tetratricopeptide (TPR) repeat protein